MMSQPRLRLDINHYFKDCKSCGNRVNDLRFRIPLRGRRSWERVRHYTLQDSGLERVMLCKDYIEERVVIHNDEERLRKAGPHTVADIHCANCREHIGYRYISGPGGDIKNGDILLIPEKIKLVYQPGILMGIREEEDQRKCICKIKPGSCNIL